MEWAIPLTHTTLGKEEIEAVTRVLEGGWLTAGPVTAAFEAAFASKLNVTHAIAVTNCTAALHLANVALGIGPGDEVICPALTFVATANATRYTGATVVFAGVSSEDDLTVSPEDIERRISQRTKALAVVHYAGFPCRMSEIMDLARRYELRIIEDCAHAPFASTAVAGCQRFVGSIGDVGCFSFFGNKNMTTGEGAMLTTNDDDIASRVRLLRSHGMTSMTYDRHRGHASSYDVTALGFNYRIDEVRSAIGLCQLSKIDALNRSRRQVVQWYREVLADMPGVKIPFATRALEPAVCHIMPVLVRRDRCEAVKKTLHGRRIQTSRHYELVNNLSLYREEMDMVSLFADYELLTLPLGPKMTREQVEVVAQGLRAGMGTS